MAKKETAVLNRVMLRWCQGFNRIFRNNQGVAWFSTDKPVRSGRDIILRDAHAVTFGVGGDGGSDLIGWRSIIITPDMVGQRIAQFAALEIKRPGGVASKEQLNFIKTVETAGGIGMVIDDDEKLTTWKL